MKKVSIIVPVYNTEKYLRKCLTSLVNQTLSDIEIIIVNDGSPDNSKKIVEKYLKEYPDKVKYFEQPNGGQGSARNLGLTKASGRFIGYVDSDDYVDLSMYQKMYDEMNKKKEMKLFNKNEEKKKWNNYLDRFNIRYGYKNRYINCDLCNRPIQNPKKQIKKYPPSEDDFVNFNY